MIGKELEKKLSLKPKNSGIILSDKELKIVDQFCDGYKDFLDFSKTERRSVKYSIKYLQEEGFLEFDPSKKYFSGDKIYLNNRDKSIIVAIIGKEPIEKGVNIIASHIDVPRIDLKPRALYEEAEISYFKTHYYGGIKKYQWTAIPLSLIGVVVKRDGSIVDICIGELDSDPVFCITDLLPHLSKDQMKKTMSEGITGENLNVLVGSRPFRDDDISEKVKLNILNHLFKSYDIIEEDFLSAELEIVPSFKARDIGFDRSVIGGYGQDDRVCAFSSLKAIVEAKDIKTTAICVLADKEEIGSEGNTGLKSATMKYFIADIAKHYNVESRTVLSNSSCLSADVNVCFDPNFKDVTEIKNTAHLNYGVVLTKYVGSRGKSGTSDASAEFVGKIRKILNDNNVIWQTGELGKVDQGGGGTVAAYIANLNVDVVDIGVPILSMHSPFELASKTDIYMAYKAFLAFYNS